MLSAKLRSEITKINIHRERFVIGYTAESLLCGDLETGLVSEVATWKLFFNFI